MFRSATIFTFHIALIHIHRCVALCLSPNNSMVFVEIDQQSWSVRHENDNLFGKKRADHLRSKSENVSVFEIFFGNTPAAETVSDIAFHIVNKTPTLPRRQLPDITAKHMSTKGLCILSPIFLLPFTFPHLLLHHHI